MHFCERSEECGTLDPILGQEEFSTRVKDLPMTVGHLSFSRNFPNQRCSIAIANAADGRTLYGKEAAPQNPSWGLIAKA